MQPTKLSKLATFNMGQSPSSLFITNNEKDTPFLQGNADFGRVYPNTHLYCQKPLKIAEKGTILVSVRAPVGALNKADQAYCIGRGLAAIHFARMLPNFGWHLLNYWAKDLSKTAQGSTFEAISKADLENLWVLAPKHEEQYSISNILDTLDTQIHQTEQLIAKLKQIKLGLLHDLLTRGIDENGDVRDPVAHPEEFKDTELGRIPREWDVCPIEEKLDRIIDYRGKTPHKTNTGIPLITARNVKEGFLDLNSTEYIKESDYDKWMNRGIPSIGDVLFTTEAPLGNIAQIPDYKVALSQRVLTLCANPEVLDKNFLLWLLLWENTQELFKTKSTGSTVVGIKQSIFRKVRLRFPTLAEQKAISKTLHQHMVRLRSEEVDLAKLKQIKKGLMDDLLTGRVRVTQLISSE